MLEKQTKLTLVGRLKSFGYAGNGIRLMLISQQNAWLHALATLLVVVLGVILHITFLEWCLITLAIIAVWTAEAMNTALEFLADVASPEFNPLVGKAKDVAAGAVLITAMGAFFIGVLIFGRHLLAMFL